MQRKRQSGILQKPRNPFNGRNKTKLQRSVLLTKGINKPIRGRQ